MLMLLTSWKTWVSIATVFRVFLLHTTTKVSYGTPVSTPNWEELISTDGIKFTGRNAHASCIFKGEIWLTGGRTALYTMYNLLDSYKVADVWHSKEGALWTQESELTGDFFAQNNDVTQPGPIAPWYQRFGHSLDAIDIDSHLVFDNVSAAAFPCTNESLVVFSCQEGDVVTVDCGNNITWQCTSSLLGDSGNYTATCTNNTVNNEEYSSVTLSCNRTMAVGNGTLVGTEPDVMVLMGGYASSPSNDIWITENGVHWIYAGLAPWSPRAWHTTVVFQGKLWLMGGSPLNNEVWMLANVTKVPRREPLTRSMFSPYTYKCDWIQLPDAPWSPRVGGGATAQWYFNESEGESIDDSRERIVMVGGYGGWRVEDSRYNGFVTRPDSWETYDGIEWTELNWNNTFGGRAWMGMDILHDVQDPRITVPFRDGKPPRMYIFGGGFIGFTTESKSRVNEMQAKSDGFWSVDGQNWVKINYDEGGGTSTVPFFSSQEWSETVVDTNTEYIGRWGLTVHSFNKTTKEQYGSFQMVLLAGDFSGKGGYASSVYRSLPGIFCDIGGVTCNNEGTCNDRTFTCECNDTHTGPLCETLIPVTSAAFGSSSRAQLWRSLFLPVLLWCIWGICTTHAFK